MKNETDARVQWTRGSNLEIVEPAEKMAHLTLRLPSAVKVLLCSCVRTAMWLINGSMAITRWERGTRTILVVSKFVVEGEKMLSPWGLIDDNVEHVRNRGTSVSVACSFRPEARPSAI